jgi:hypothetical protein
MQEATSKKLFALEAQTGCLVALRATSGYSTFEILFCIFPQAPMAKDKKGDTFRVPKRT